MTTVSLNDEIEMKLSKLTDMENTTKSEVIKKAITEYDERHVQDRTPYELGKKLFGKYGANSDQSQTYKQRLKGRLNEKHTH